MSLRHQTAAAALAALLLGGMGLHPPADAQAATRRAGEAARTRVATVPTSRSMPRSEAMARGRYVVVVDLDANRLYFARGRRVLWSAPVGTGTGLRLETERRTWDFDTPNGVFHVQHKEKDPVWIAPDWYFVENNLPVPAENSPRRRFPGGLGSAAVYLGHGLAIHGTDKPELLGQRVSHGCIRLSNADALRLMHNVQPGTEVVIVGGPDEPATPPPPRRGGSGGPPKRDAFLAAMEGLTTPSLLSRLDDEMIAATVAGSAVRWPTVASVLVSRGVQEGDDLALEGLLGRVGTLGRGALRDEFATVLADVYARGTTRTLETLGTMEPTERRRAAEAIVEASILLYPGEADSRTAPWPTRRAPRDVLERLAQRGWDALSAAEAGHRDRLGMAPVRPVADRVR